MDDQAACTIILLVEMSTIAQLLNFELLYMTIEVSSFVPSAITRSFFELQAPEFSWKFVWTVPTNYAK